MPKKQLKNIQIFEGSPMLMKENTIYEVQPLLSNYRSLIEGSLYMYDGDVLEYRGDVTHESECTESGLYTIEYRYIYINEGNGDGIFDIDDVTSYNPSDMLERLGRYEVSEQFAAAAISDKNTPVINDDDSGFDKVIKAAIIEKGIDPKSYREKLPKEHTIGNMISSLKKTGSDMSTLYFMNWIEVMDLDFTLEIRDNGKDPYPIGSIIRYDSRTDDIEIVDED